MNVLKARLLRRLTLSALVTAAVGVTLVLLWPWLIRVRPAGIRLLFDGYDIVHSYLPASDWMFVRGAPGGSLRSGYPFLANLLFGLCRLCAEVFPVFPALPSNMVWWWMLGAAFSLMSLLQWVARDLSRPAVLLWLLPVSLYFTLYRFDFYPAALTLLVLVACKHEKWLAATLCLGLAIGLKGYLIFALPAYALFLSARLPWRRTALLVALTLVPSLAASAFAATVGGWRSVLAPFALQAQRPLNGESTYDAAAYLLKLVWGDRAALHLLAWSRGMRVAGHILQIAAALLAAAWRPVTIAELARAMLFSVLAFWNFEGFSSPQFVLWLLPMLCFLPVDRAFGCGVTVVGLAFLTFPVAYDSFPALGTRAWFQASIILFTMARFVLMVMVAVKGSRGLMATARLPRAVS